MRISFSKKRIGIAVATAVPLLILFFYFTRGFWLTQMGRLLLVDETIDAPHDVVLILAGDLHYRPKKAAELLAKGLAKKVVWMNPESSKEAELNICPNYHRSILILMKRYGVPEEKFLYFNNRVAVSSTKEDALTFRKFLETEGKDVRSVIIVTSWFHTRRAKKTFLRYLNRPDLKFTVVASYGDSAPENWWQFEESFLIVYAEYLKWVYHSFLSLSKPS